MSQLIDSCGQQIFYMVKRRYKKIKGSIGIARSRNDCRRQRDWIIRGVGGTEPVLKGVSSYMGPRGKARPMPVIERPEKEITRELSMGPYQRKAPWPVQLIALTLIIIFMNRSDWHELVVWRPATRPTLSQAGYHQKKPTFDRFSGLPLSVAVSVSIGILIK